MATICIASTDTGELERLREFVRLNGRRRILSVVKKRTGTDNEPRGTGLPLPLTGVLIYPTLDILPMPEPRSADHDDRRWEVSGLLGVQEALAGLPADQLQDLARADEIGGVDLLALGPDRHGSIIAVLAFLLLDLDID